MVYDRYFAGIGGGHRAMADVASWCWREEECARRECVLETHDLHNRRAVHRPLLSRVYDASLTLFGHSFPRVLLPPLVALQGRVAACSSSRRQLELVAHPKLTS